MPGNPPKPSTALVPVPAQAAPAKREHTTEDLLAILSQAAETVSMHHNRREDKPYEATARYMGQYLSARAGRPHEALRILARMMMAVKG